MDGKKVKLVVEEAAKGLPPFYYMKTKIEHGSLNAFVYSEKKVNDSNNKMRETIVGAIINNKVPEAYFKNSGKWTKMKNAITQYIDVVITKHLNDIVVESIVCIHKGGRGFNYDYTLVVNGIHELYIELKFNASDVSETPQFVSPMKPSQYMTGSYEEHFYDNYLPKLPGGLELPDRSTYLQQIHNNAPSCMSDFQRKYYQGCKGSSKYTGKEEDILFYTESKSISKKSIQDFLEKNELEVKKLNDYLIGSQKNKIYMMYKNGRFHYQTVCTDDYTLVSYVKEPAKSRFVATSKSGKKVKILLRWKNGNGIAFPAFQIS